MAERKPQVTYVSLGMVRHLSLGRDYGVLPFGQKAEMLEEFDPEAKEAHKIAGKYIRKM